MQKNGIEPVSRKPHKSQKLHSETHHSTIQYNEKEVKIPQDYQKLTDFQESDTQVMIIHGAAGAGKSATVKDFLEAEKNQKEKITLMFSASDLDVKEEKSVSL